MKESLHYTVPGSHGAGDLTLTVHAPVVELTDAKGGMVTLSPGQVTALTQRLSDIEDFFDTGEM